jgi:hypothetical protein
MLFPAKWFHPFHRVFNVWINKFNRFHRFQLRQLFPFLRAERFRLIEYICDCYRVKSSKTLHPLLYCIDSCKHLFSIAQCGGSRSNFRRWVQYAAVLLAA